MLLFNNKREKMHEYAPFDVVFVFRESSSSHHSGCFTQVADKIIAEVEGHRIFISVKPPEDKWTINTILNTK